MKEPLILRIGGRKPTIRQGSTSDIGPCFQIAPREEVSIVEGLLGNPGGVDSHFVGWNRRFRFLGKNSPEPVWPGQRLVSRGSVFKLNAPGILLEPNLRDIPLRVTEQVAAHAVGYPGFVLRLVVGHYAGFDAARLRR